MQTIYHYDPETRALVGEGLADRDPRNPDGPGLVPAHATCVARPQEIPEGHFARFDIDAQAWSIEPIPQPESPPAQPAPPPPTLDELKLAAQAALDAFFEVLYVQAVPNPAIANEYTSAYQSAKAWLDAGATGAAPLRVTAMAESMGTEEAPVTEQEAAEYVVLKYLEAESVLDRRGAARLRAKAAVRACTTPEQIAAAVDAGKDAMGSIGYTI